MSKTQLITPAATRASMPSPAVDRQSGDAPSVFTRSTAAEPAAIQVDQRAHGSLGPAEAQRVLAPLNSSEMWQAQQLARTLAPTQRASRYFDSRVPSHAFGPYSGNHYTFTCCPMEHERSGPGNFSLDDMLDEAFRTGTRTTISLTSEGDQRHSNYYKTSQTTPSGKYTIKSYGTPEFTTAVNQRGRAATGSIFYNTVRNNQTGEIAHMKMIHVNGWPDQTAVDSRNELKLMTYIGNKLDPKDLKKVMIHCTEGRNRTASWTTHLEMMSAATRGIAPDARGVVDWMRRSRVADAMFVPEQLNAVAESQVRLSRLAARHGGHRFWR